MFSITARGVYGLSAVVELGKTYGQGTRQIRDIAETHSIPQHYLEQILVILKKAGIVESFRGAQGGYALAKHPSEISVLQVLSLLEGKLEVMPDSRREDDLEFFWTALQETIQEYLTLSLEELLNRVSDRQQFIYSI